MRIGVDLGGTKIEAAAFDGLSELARRRIATPAGDYMGTVMAIAGLVEALEIELGQRGSVGVGIPGVESAQTGCIKNANSTCLIGQPLKRDLQTVLQREIRLANDANCFALSEAVDGAGAGADAVFGVILGTGVGGGVAIREQVLTGANSIAGEWGHNPLPEPTEEDLPAPACYCGRHGCVETWLSGPGMARDHANASGEFLTPEIIAARAVAGDAACEATLQRYENRLARSLAVVINILDPQIIVLGGGVSNLDRLYENVPQQWGAHIFSDHVATKLVKHRHGDSSGVRGAAWLWGE
ncbi:MAG: fructokinase [Pseudomonadota bacterium]|nr:fructokinase [Pseudomonadota bacterium]MDQ5881949.1 fructokinase [Pseudomonadota bacterium]MDQ5915319.1 fructokinase [Pseudomonadota bacterium]MDQ5942146.1 fructokinase [Pseudomonadota bacterium]MDQ5945199.1 fructokinase [Pseudomonadota bacterium]